MNKKILLVDDETIILKALGKDLRHHGYTVRTASNGEEALQAVEEEFFDLVITDVIMAPGDGIQVLQGVKNKRPTTGVILLTGHGDISSAISGLRFGADDYLSKPWDHNELLFRVSQCLQKYNCQKELTHEREKTTDLLQHSGELTRIQRTLEREIVNHTATQKDLEETNITLKHLLKMRDGEKLHLEEKALLAMKESVLHHLLAIKKEVLTPSQHANLHLVETNLNRFIRTFTTGFTTTFLKLTPMEIEVIECIQAGKSTKEIAEKLKTSPRTVENHRLSIRKKIGIKHSGATLKSSLRALY